MKERGEFVQKALDGHNWNKNTNSSRWVIVGIQICTLRRHSCTCSIFTKDALALH